MHLSKLVSALDGLSLSAEYWDVRMEDTFETMVVIRDGEVVTCASSPALGAFVRVRKNGFWLYQSTTEIATLKEVLERLDRETVPTAPASSPSTNGEAPFRAEKQAPFERLSFSDTKFSAVPLERKLALAKRYDVVLEKTSKVVSRWVIYKDLYKTKSYLNSVGTKFEFDFNQGGFRCWYTMKDGDSMFEDAWRNYATRFEDLAGKEDALAAHAKESLEFLDAPAIEPGKYKVLLDPKVAGIFTHESFGHKSEADFMIGNTEALEEWKLGSKIGADCLTIVDYGGHERTSGWCPIDDDGTPCQKNYLIKDGVLTGRLHSRETARQLGESPTGNSRALNFEFEPIVRMTSTYIEPGTESLEAIMKRSEGAILVKGSKHGSGLSTFTIAPSRGYRIASGGKLEPLRLTVISGSIFETLNNVEAVSSDFELDSTAIGGCGKMEQAPLPVSDGGPYVLVKDMQVS